MKIWEKGIKTNEKILQFTVGKDRDLDLFLAESDIIASVAHVKMLLKTGLLKSEEEKSITRVLLEEYQNIINNDFTIDEGVEDIHSQLEKILIERLGDAGKKVHTARSRNDQVMTDLKLYFRTEIATITHLIQKLVNTLLEKSARTENMFMPGYTHLQAAMNSSFGLWFSAWAEAFTEDILPLKGAMDYVNQNPLGSAAGYGSSFPVDREMTAELLGFDDLHINSINAQLSRGKTEKISMAAMSNVAGDLSKMSMDLVLFLNQNFDLVSLEDDMTTGSSIMPHKKNPDVLELIRAKTNMIQSSEVQVLTLINNLPSGYHRDFQLLKEICFPAIEELKACLEIMTFLVPGIKPKENLSDRETYKYLGSVDAINEKVKSGLAFRDAYREIADEIRKGKYKPADNIKYTHTGSIGNLAIDRIRAKLEKAIGSINPEKYIGFNKNFYEKYKQDLQ